MSRAEAYMQYKRQLPRQQSQEKTEIKLSKRGDICVYMQAHRVVAMNK